MRWIHIYKYVYNCNKTSDQSQMCWDSEPTASSRGWRGIFNPLSGVWNLAHMHAQNTYFFKNKENTYRGRQAAGFFTVASVFKPGTPQWCQPCTHQAAGGRIAVSGGQRDRHRAHFSHSSWLSRSGGKERCDCFSSCSLWSRTRLSQWEKRISSKHLWWQSHSPAFKMKFITF